MPWRTNSYPERLGDSIIQYEFENTAVLGGSLYTGTRSPVPSYRVLVCNLYTFFLKKPPGTEFLY